MGDIIAHDTITQKSIHSEYGVHGKLLRAIQALYEGGKACVKVGQSETEMFDVQKK